MENEVGKRIRNIRQLRGYSQEEFAEIAAITSNDIRDWLAYLNTRRNDRLNKPYNPSYLAKVFKMLSAFFSWVEKHYDIPNPMKKVRPPRVTAARPVNIWSREQFDTFISVVTNPAHRALFGILFFTGRRKSEVIALHAADVLPDRILFNKAYTSHTLDGSPYKITTTKNDTVAFSPICAPLKEILSDYAPQSPFFFGGETPINEARVNALFTHYTAAANLPPYPRPRPPPLFRFNAYPSRCFRFRRSRRHRRLPETSPRHLRSPLRRRQNRPLRRNKIATTPPRHSSPFNAFCAIFVPSPLKPLYIVAFTPF